MLDYFDSNQEMSMRHSNCPVATLSSHMDLRDFHYTGSAKCNQLSPTSTLSSGYESGCTQSEIDDLMFSMNLLDDQQQTEESEYFLLESDQYVCLGGEVRDDTGEKLKQVRDSMLRIVNDLESLGYETSLDELSHAVSSSVRKSRPCPRSAAQKTRQTSQQDNNDIYTKSPVDVMFTEINHMTDKCDRELLYDRLITNIAKECDISSASDDEDEPIYEEIQDLNNDFDFVAHSDTYRKRDTPPALPPRTNATSRKPNACKPPKFQRQVSLPDSQSDDVSSMSTLTDKKTKSCHAINAVGHRLK